MNLYSLCKDYVIATTKRGCERNRNRQRDELANLGIHRWSEPEVEVLKQRGWDVSTVQFEQQ